MLPHPTGAARMSGPSWSSTDPRISMAALRWGARLMTLVTTRFEHVLPPVDRCSGSGGMVATSRTPTSANRSAGHWTTSESMTAVFTGGEAHLFHLLQVLCRG